MSEGQLEGSESQLEGSESQLEGSEGQLEGSGGQLEESEGQLSGGDRRTKEQMEFIPILQDFVPYRGCCPKMGFRPENPDLASFGG